MKRCFQQTFLLLFVTLLLYLYNDLVLAQPVVTLVLDPDIHTLTLDDEPQEIIIIARTDQQNVQFLWSLEGPGILEGDKTSPGILYVAPEKIDQERAEAIIHVRVTDAEQRAVHASTTLTIQAPQNQPTPESQSISLTIRSNVYDDMVIIDGKEYGSTRLDVELPAGEHNILVKKEGYIPWETDLDLQTPQTIWAKLTPQAPTTKQPQVSRPPEETPQPAVSSKSIPSSQPSEFIPLELRLNRPFGEVYHSGEEITIHFRTIVSGYVTLCDVNTRGQFAVLFPNSHVQDNFVKANALFTIPDETYSYDLVVEGPAGIETIYALFSPDTRYHWQYTTVDETLLKNIIKAPVKINNKRYVITKCELSVRD